MKRSNNSFTTERLHGRIWRPTDEAALEAFYSNPTIQKSLDVARVFESWNPETRVLDNQAHVQRHGYGMMALWETGTDELVGTIGLLNVGGSEYPELHLVINPRFWGRGFATEAVGSLIRYARRNLKLTRLNAILHPDNPAAERVLLKNGYQELHPILTPLGTELLVFHYSNECGR